MKQFYTAAFAVLLTTAVTAQGLLPMANKTANQRRLEAFNTPTEVERDVIWSHDCNVDSCSSWVFDNGSPIAGSPWEDIDLNFECTVEGPAGPYNQWAGGTGDGSAASPMNSTTADNGLLIVDSDLFGADANYDAAWIENSWVQTADPIDCSSLEFVSISMETRYRCWDNGASDDSEKCLIEVSRDGVNWPSIETFAEIDGTVDYGDGELVASRWEVFPGFETSDGTDNPSLVEFDITTAAGGQEQIWVRFRWSGTWGYSWEIDDIQIYQTPANDLRIDNYTSYTDYFTTGVYEAGVFAAGQLSELQAAAKVYNVGYLDQEGSTLALGVNGSEVGASDPITISYQTDDTLRVVYDMSEVGTYDLTYTVSATVEDENPGNNSASQSFEVSYLHYGRDNGTMVAAFPAEGTDDFIALAPYDIFEDVTVYAIDVAIVAGSEDGTPVIAHLFDGADENYITEQYGGLIVSTSELDLAAQYSNDGTEDDVLWYTLVLEEPTTLPAGSVIGAGFEHYGGSSVQIWESQYTYDNTAFVYGPFGSGSAYDWYYTNETPMVRLNLNPDATNTVSVKEVATANFQLYPLAPNPANASTRLQYRLDQNSDVALEVRDITGKLVTRINRGTQAVGYHSITLDVEEYNAGVYMTTLVVNGARATERLLVD
ncbi:MAG: T9SS type A sorting domain-containing protein [Crocinitomicaceae bacterium]|nr:T9SS type A sorting domain-containing protein [Crocinitomicaceae bacterium]